MKDEGFFTHRRRISPGPQHPSRCGVFLPTPNIPSSFRIVSKCAESRWPGELARFHAARWDAPAREAMNYALPANCQTTALELLVLAFRFTTPFTTRYSLPCPNCDST